jgi:hypothetical protein
MYRVKIKHAIANTMKTNVSFDEFLGVITDLRISVAAHI